MVMVDFTPKSSDSKCGDSPVKTDHMTFIIIPTLYNNILYNGTERQPNINN